MSKGGSATIWNEETLAIVRWETILLYWPWLATDVDLAVGWCAKSKSVAAILAGLASAEINDMIHDKELHQLDGSTNFLVNYSKS
jgi:hypothetical protein